MYENVFLPPEAPSPESAVQIAVLGTGNSSSGWTLILDGQTTESQKLYKTLSSSGALSQGDRVLVARVSGSYVIIGKIGN